MNETNDPLHPDEGAVLKTEYERDPRFRKTLRLDSALINWPNGVSGLQALGFEVNNISDYPKTRDEVRRYVAEHLASMRADYAAISLPSDFDFNGKSGKLLQHSVFPAVKEAGVPIALMIGVERQWRPQLRGAGDGLGRFELSKLRALLEAHPDVKFLVTVLSLENQHELMVMARKYSNLKIFGFWWFLNNPSVIKEVLSQRLDLLGLSHIGHNSDARILEQLIYKWDHLFEILGEALTDKYVRLARNGMMVTEEEVIRDLKVLFPQESIW